MAVLTVFKPNEISHKLEINSEIPIGAGLGSSAAVAVATVTAALKLKGKSMIVKPFQIKHLFVKK